MGFPIADPAGQRRPLAFDRSALVASQTRSLPMTVNHRRWHFWVWLILGPLIVIGLIASRKGMVP
jgi:hypothetical protein